MSGRRLLVRLTTRCNSGCAHCTIADIAHLPDRPVEEVWAEIVRGRQQGCDELVFMRGEPTIHKQLIKLTRRARGLGYAWVQVQTNARMLAYGPYLEKLLAAGMSFFEVSWFGHTAGLHDLVDGTPGAFEQATAGLRNLVAAGAPLMASVPIIARTAPALPAIVEHLHGLGVGRVQLAFVRPVKVGPAWSTAPLIRLDRATPFVREALRRARALGMAAETEGVPLCHLDPEDHVGGDVAEDFGRHQVADVHVREDSRAEYRRHSRPRAPQCEACALSARCPTTWAAYQRLFGTWELRGVGSAGSDLDH